MKKYLLAALLLIALPVAAQAAPPKDKAPQQNPAPAVTQKVAPAKQQPAPAKVENKIANQKAEQKVERQGDLQKQNTKDAKRDFDQKRPK